MRKPDPVEIVMIGVPVLIEAICVTVAIGCAIVLVALLSMPWAT
jgi:hypothetical protein